jgi:hypothetical protein
MFHSKNGEHVWIRSTMVEPMRVRLPDHRLQERETRLFNAAWGWLTAALMLAVVVAIIAIMANVMRSPAPADAVPPLAMRPPADDPANPPAAAAPNTRRALDQMRR